MKRPILTPCPLYCVPSVYPFLAFHLERTLPGLLGILYWQCDFSYHFERLSASLFVGIKEEDNLRSNNLIVKNPINIEIFVISFSLFSSFWCVMETAFGSS